MRGEVPHIVIAVLDPLAGPKPLRRGEGPAIHRPKGFFRSLMDARVKPAHDDRGAEIAS
jgi:peptide/nickel transport system ATP-binding protein